MCWLYLLHAGETSKWSWSSQESHCSSLGFSINCSLSHTPHPVIDSLLITFQPDPFPFSPLPEHCLCAGSIISHLNSIHAIPLLADHPVVRHPSYINSLSTCHSLAKVNSKVGGRRRYHLKEPIIKGVVRKKRCPLFYISWNCGKIAAE